MSRLRSIAIVTLARVASFSVGTDSSTTRTVGTLINVDALDFATALARLEAFLALLTGELATVGGTTVDTALVFTVILLQETLVDIDARGGVGRHLEPIQADWKYTLVESEAHYVGIVLKIPNWTVVSIIVISAPERRFTVQAAIGTIADKLVTLIQITTHGPQLTVHVGKYVWVAIVDN